MIFNFGVEKDLENVYITISDEHTSAYRIYTYLVGLKIKSRSLQFSNKKLQYQKQAKSKPTDHLCCHIMYGQIKLSSSSTFRAAITIHFHKVVINHQTGYKNKYLTKH